MRKICLLFLIVMLILSLAACKAETVTLRCDGEGCENTVEVEVKNKETPDEDWVVFCDECVNTVLKD